MEMFDGDTVHARLDYPSLVAALEAHHLRDIDAVRSNVLEQPKPDGLSARFLTLPAWQYDRAMGTKLVTVFPENEKNGSGLPSVQAVYVLFDGGNGKPAACIDGTALTLRKTASDSALGAKFLARPDATSMLMVGAGALAPHLIMAHHAVRPGLTSVAIWNRTPERAEALAAGMDLPGVTITATTDIEA
ncbi:MAG: ornithine cyclodeaminase, partial [Hyphomicrobiaceae bacterium]